jgi:hypothetical protein
MRFCCRRFLLTFALSFVCVVNTAQSAPLTYFGADSPRGTLTNSNAAFNSFVATLSSYGIDDLESYPNFTVNPTLTFGTTGLTALPDFRQVATFALFAVSGTNSLVDAGPSSPTGTAINDNLTFNKPITAFGSYFSNAGDSAVANTISLRLENTLLGTSKLVSIGTRGPSLSFDNVFFLGITDTEPFNKVSLLESYDYDGILLDNITAGYVAIPEASSFLLCGLVLTGLAVAGWRSRAAHVTSHR